MISKPKQNSIERLGTATDGLGSERYKLVKKMVIGGMLRGSINSIRDSSLMIGASTAKKYHAALIRDGVIQKKGNAQKPKRDALEQRLRGELMLFEDETLGDEVISEEKMFRDFLAFINEAEKKNIRDYSYLESEHRYALRFANYDLIRNVVNSFIHLANLQAGFGNNYRTGIAIIKTGELK